MLWSSHPSVERVNEALDNSVDLCGCLCGFVVSSHCHFAILMSLTALLCYLTWYGV
jgi:hypothetical protein